MIRSGNSHADAFFRLFREEWARGGWSWKRFADAMKAAGARSLDYKTCMSWLSPTKHPNTVTEANKVAILHALFGDCDAERVHHREAMERAWQGTRGLLPAEAPAPSPPTATRPAGEDWVFLGTPFTLHERLVQLSLQEPRAANREAGAAESYHLHVALKLGQLVEMETPKGEAVFVSLRMPFLAVSGAGYRVEEGSELGGKDRANDHLAPTTGGWEVLASANARDQELTEQKYLAVIQGNPAPGAEVAVTLTGTGRCFDLRGTDASGNPGPPLSVNRDAVLNALFRDVLPKEGNAMLLAKDRMRRKGEG